MDALLPGAILRTDACCPPYSCVRVDQEPFVIRQWPRQISLHWFALCLIGFALISAVGCGGKSKAERLHQEGTLLYKHARYYPAIDKFEDALKIEPDRVSTLRMLADA